MAFFVARRFLVAITGFVGLMFAALSAHANEARRFVIASGPVGGAYYRLAGEVCEAFAVSTAKKTADCLVLPTTGSEENLARLAEGGADFAILQSDWLYRAQSESQPDLRAVVALQGRFVTVVAGPASGIFDGESLKGRRVSFGPGESPLSFGGETFLAAHDWEREDLEAVVPLELSALPEALCDGEIDAFILPLVHPDPVVAQSLALCEAQLVEVNGPEIDEALKAWPFMSALTLAPEIYTGQAKAVEGFGLRATLTTTEQVQADLVASLTDAVVGRRSDARDLTRKMAAPLHPAAAERLTELGVLEGAAAAQ
jgi:TRAP transporter TAXI family solute receptor